MRVTKTTAFLQVLIIFIAFISFGCSKSSSISSTLVGDWARSSEFEGVSRSEAVSFIIGDTLYMGGGFDGTNRLTDFWAFNQSTGTWYRRADFPGTARNSAVGFSANGYGFIGTGFDGINKLNDFWKFNPATNSWTRVADFPGTARYGAVAFGINNKGYVTTGYDGTYLKDLWQYDPTSNSWSQKASLGGDKRSNAVVFVYNNSAYVVTGINNGSYLNDMWVYDPTANVWTEKRKISNATDQTFDDTYGTNIVRSNAAIFLIDSKAYLTGGTNGTVMSTTWEYDIASDLWAQKTSFEGASREGSIGFTLKNRGYITSGNNSSAYYDDLWEFLPTTAVNANNN
jgi:N-acetylneuraminic acid mutarotase